MSKKFELSFFGKEDKTTKFELDITFKPSENSFIKEEDSEKAEKGIAQLIHKHFNERYEEYCILIKLTEL